jgi:hypothetical protein
MKYLITESKLKDIIFKYLDDSFDLENLYWEEDDFFDWDTGHNIEVIYFGDDEGMNNMGVSPVIEYFKYPSNPEGWTEDELQYLPSFRFVDDNVKSLLTKMFGDTFEPFAIEWFKSRSGFDSKNIF